MLDEDDAPLTTRRRQRDEDAAEAADPSAIVTVELHPADSAQVEAGASRGVRLRGFAGSRFRGVRGVRGLPGWRVRVPGSRVRSLRLETDARILFWVAWVYNVVADVSHSARPATRS